MSRPVLILVAALLVLAGLLVFFSTQASERPTARVEQAVSLANLQ